MGEHDAVEVALRSWLRDAGGYVSPGVALMAALPGGERGVRATRAIPAGQQLAVVPQRLCVFMPPPGDGASTSTATAASGLEAAGAFLRSAAPELNPFLATTLLLMHELGQGNQAAPCRPLRRPAHPPGRQALDHAPSSRRPATHLPPVARRRVGPPAWLMHTPPLDPVTSASRDACMTRQLRGTAAADTEESLR